MALDFAWDPRKAASNESKHGVTFDEASTFFGDPLEGNDGLMKSTSEDPTSEDGLRDHYEFSGGIRGKYAARYAEGRNVVVLEPDVAKKFPTSETVKEALRRYALVHQE